MNPKTIAMLLAPNSLAIVDGNSAGIPENMKNIRQIHMKYPGFSVYSVVKNVPAKTTNPKEIQHMDTSGRKKMELLGMISNGWFQLCKQIYSLRTHTIHHIVLHNHTSR